MAAFLAFCVLAAACSSPPATTGGVSAPAPSRDLGSRASGPPPTSPEPAPSEPAGESGGLVRARYTMGTTATVTIEAADVPRERWAALAEEALDRIDEVDRAASLYKPESDLCRLNAESYPGPYKPGPIVAELLGASARFHRITDGAFDPTVKPLMDELGFYREIGSRPDPGGLPGALARVGWRRLAWDPPRGTVRFLVPGMALDFGGIAKGYALDRAAAALRARGVRRAQLELGRSWLFLGSDPSRPDGRFRLAVTVPEPPGEERVAGAVQIPEGSVATSSPFGQMRGRGSGLVGHIVDPRRGPVPSRVAAVVVWAPAGTDADALTKAFVIAGPEAGETLAGRARFEAAILLARGEKRPAGRLGPLRRIGQSGGRDLYATPGLLWEPLDPR